MREGSSSRNRVWSLRRFQELGSVPTFSLSVSVGFLLTMGLLIGCSSCTWNVALVDYRPTVRSDWQVSTPEEQGLERRLLDEAYFNALKLETLYGMLVVKNGYLIAEAYFNEGSIEQVSGRQSATKSVTSALVGIALDRGHLTSLDQNMVDFFPELLPLSDSRKNQITLRQLLKMRGGYVDEEKVDPYFDIMFMSGDYHWVPHLQDFPLVADPGSEFNYSNLTSHLLGVIVSRASAMDLSDFAEQYLFSPIGGEVAHWTADADGYCWGSGELHITARSMAKFGQLYLEGGSYGGNQIIPPEYVSASLGRYSTGINLTGWIDGISSRYGSFKDLGYGYQWWSATSGGHNFSNACGHGGNYIILLHDLDMVIVTTADPLHDLWDENPWKYEGAINKVVGKFIASLPEA